MTALFNAVWSDYVGVAASGIRRVASILGLCEQDGTQLQTQDGENLEVYSWRN